MAPPLYLSNRQSKEPAMGKHTVKSAFPYSEDGLTSKDMKPGDEITVRDDLVEGLVAGGFIDPELASKVAGAAIKEADLSEVVTDTQAVTDKIATAEAGISDGHIGKPEAAAIVDENKPIPTLPAVEGNVVEADKPADDKAKSDAKKA
jgi:hypothetical protein